MNNKYILNWNDEYLDQSILAGPVSLEQAHIILENKLMDSIMNATSCSQDKAYELLTEAQTGEDAFYHGINISCHQLGGSVSGSYEDRYQIVSFDSTNENAVESI